MLKLFKTIGKGGHPGTQWPIRLILPLITIILLAIPTTFCLADDPNLETGSDQRKLIDLSDWSKLWNWPGEKDITDKAKGRVLLEQPQRAGAVNLVFDGSQGPACVSTANLELIPGHRYRLYLEVWRRSIESDQFLLVELFGRKFHLNQHWTRQHWQPVSIAGIFDPNSKNIISLINYSKGTFKIRRPVLVDLGPGAGSPKPARTTEKTVYEKFPLGVYISPARVGEVEGSPFNLVITSANTKERLDRIIKTADSGIRSIIACPTNPFKIAQFSLKFSGLPPEARPLHFYLSDEPELSSEPVLQLRNLRQKLKDHLPWASTATAMVRPLSAAEYSPAYDAIFMDQYPIPGQPINWLSDSIGQAKKDLGSRVKIWAVIQAFGGQKFARYGWPRMPDIKEVKALTLGSLAAGADGLAFFKWDYLIENKELFESTMAFLEKLAPLTEWFPLTSGLPPELKLEHFGRVKTSPSGNTAVRIGHGRIAGKQLLICVNETPYPVHFEISGFPEPGSIKDAWSGGDKILSQGKIWDRLEGFGFRVWVF